MTEKDLRLTPEELKQLHTVMVKYELDNELEETKTPYESFITQLLVNGELGVMSSDNEDDLLVGSLEVVFNLVEGCMHTKIHLSSTEESKLANICNLEDTLEPYCFEKVDPASKNKLFITLTIKDKEIIVNVKEYLTAAEIIKDIKISTWDAYYSMANEYFQDIQLLIENEEDSLENLLDLLKN